MADVLVVMLLIAGPVVVVALVVLEVVFRRRDVGRLWRRIVETERKLRKRVDDVRQEAESARRRLKEAATTYEDGYVRRLLRRRPIRDLHQYLSVSMSWAALERAGITDLEKFMAFRGDFERLRGIGEARGRGLRGARRKLRAELGESTLPMPPLRPPESLEFRVVSAALYTTEIDRQVVPKAKALKEELEEFRRHRPGAVGVRWRHWTGGGEPLRDELGECEKRLQSIVDELAGDLDGAHGEIVEANRDFERVQKRYQAAEQRVRRLIDEATTRAVRGALRPVGVDAMRAAEGFDDEEDFCDRGLEPLIEKLGYDHRREHTINRRIGSSDTTLYVDFLLIDAKGPVAVLEAKRSIRTDNDLEDARKQGLSYALFEELKPVMVAAPEGLWLYERDGQELAFCREYEIEEAYASVDELRSAIDAIAGRVSRRRPIEAE